MAAGEPAATRQFRAGTALVLVDVVATQADGNLNRDLKRDDFLIFEDGKPQEVKQFQVVDLEAIAAETVDPPGVFSNRAEPGAVFALVLDDMNVDSKHTALMQTTARRFVDEQVRIGDYVGVMRTGANSPLLLTTDRDLVRPMIAQTMGRRDINDVSSLTGGTGDALPMPGANTGQMPDFSALGLFDQSPAARIQAEQSLVMLQRVVEYLAPIPARRKAVLLFSQGIAFDLEAFAADSNSRSFDTMRRLLSAAREGNVAVYTVDPRGLQGSTDPSLGEKPVPVTRDAGVDTLRDLATATGGRAVVSSNEIADAFNRISRENRFYYLIGYEPSDSGGSPTRARQIEVKTKAPGTTLLHRRAYSPSAATAVAAIANRTPIASPLPVPDLMISMAPVVFPDPSGGASLAVPFEVGGNLPGNDTVKYTLVAIDGRGVQAGRMTGTVRVSDGAAKGMVRQKLRSRPLPAAAAGRDRRPRHRRRAGQRADARAKYRDASLWRLHAAAVRGRATAAERDTVLPDQPAGDGGHRAVGPRGGERLAGAGRAPPRRTRGRVATRAAAVDRQRPLARRIGHPGQRLHWRCGIDPALERATGSRLPNRTALRVNTPMRMTLSSWLVAAGVALTAAGHIRAQAPAPTADPASTAPFFAGVTDPGSLARIVNDRLAAARATLEQLTSASTSRTAEQTLRTYDNIQVHISAAKELAYVVRQLHPDAAMRTAAETLAPAVEAFETELALNPAAYGALSAVSIAGAPADLARYLKLKLDDYRRDGVDKDATTRAKINGLRDQLVRLGQDFDRNVREGARTLPVAGAAELAGLPPDFIAARKPRADGSIALTTNASDLQPVMLYARSDDLRRRMLLESQNIAATENLAVLQRLVETRAELARTLGFKDWAALDLSNRMAATPQNAAAFIDRIVAASAAKADTDYQLILARKKQDQPAATIVNAWERRYYTELVRQSSYSFDSQAMRPYFSYERVRAGVFSVSSRLFGLEFRAGAGPGGVAPVGQAVRSVRGRPARRPDLPRHAPARRQGWQRCHGRHRPLGNPRPPDARSGVDLPASPAVRPGDPGLMTFDQVTTFFHEFGHLVHAISSGRQRWLGLTRIAERDFMEAPSQMLEEWVSDPATLATFAAHYQTGEPIPAALVRQMRRANELGRGYDIRQQMVFAKLSLSLHDRDPKSADAMAIYKDLMTRYLPTVYPEGTHFPATFTQLSNPLYTASYYTYMWSLVIAKDLFSGFDPRDLLAPGPARRFRETILAQGGSKPAADLVRDFLGRPYSFDAWAAWLNTATPPPSAR